MKFTILTLFPDDVQAWLGHSILGRAIADGNLSVEVRNLRDWATDKHKTVDDTPYGGGPGMVLRVDVVDRALSDLQSNKSEARSQKTVLLTPQGERFTQQLAEQFAEANADLILIAGHFEGFDERIRSLVDVQISIGDFVLTGGELPALTIVDAVARLLPGTLATGSAHEESWSLQHEEQRLLEYPHYTRPEHYAPVSRELGEMDVPAILKTGDHARIAAWRLDQARSRTEVRQNIEPRI